MDERLITIFQKANLGYLKGKEVKILSDRGVIQKVIQKDPLKFNEFCIRYCDQELVDLTISSLAKKISQTDESAIKSTFQDYEYCRLGTHILEFSSIKPEDRRIAIIYSTLLNLFPDIIFDNYNWGDGQSDKSIRAILRYKQVFKALIDRLYVKNGQLNCKYENYDIEIGCLVSEITENYVPLSEYDPIQYFAKVSIYHSKAINIFNLRLDKLTIDEKRRVLAINGLLINHLKDSDKYNIELITTAIQSNPESYNYLPVIVKSNEIVIELALRVAKKMEKTNVLRLPEDLLNKEVFCFQLLDSGYPVYRLLPDKIKSTPSIFTKALEIQHISFDDIPKVLLSNPKLVLKYLEHDITAIFKIDVHTLNLPIYQIILPSLLKGLKKYLDRDLFMPGTTMPDLVAVKEYEDAILAKILEAVDLKHLIFNDEEYCKSLVDIHLEMVNYVNNHTFIDAAYLKKKLKSEFDIKLFPETVLNNEENALAILESVGPKGYKHLPKSIRSNKSFFSSALDLLKDGTIINDAEPNVKDDASCKNMAMNYSVELDTVSKYNRTENQSNSPSSTKDKFLHEEMLPIDFLKGLSKEDALLLVKSKGWTFRYLAEENRGDFDIIMAAIETEPSVIRKAKLGKYINV